MRDKPIAFKYNGTAVYGQTFVYCFINQKTNEIIHVGYDWQKPTELRTLAWSSSLCGEPIRRLRPTILKMAYKEAERLFEK